MTDLHSRISPDGIHKAINGAYKLEFRVMPKGPGNRVGGFLALNDSSIMKSSTHPNEAWEVLKWRTGDEIRRAFLSAGNGGVPALKATANSPEYLNDKLPVEWNKMFIQTMNIVKLAPPIPQWTDITNTVAAAVEQIKRGEIAPASAVKDLVPRVNALLG